MEHSVIYRNPSSYSHNPDITVTPDGAWLMVFREAPRRRNCTHIDPLSRATVVRSTDEGRTWSDPISSIEGPGDIGIQDPSIHALRSGRIICNYFAWDAPADAPYGAEVPGVYASISDDGGKTWSPDMIVVDSTPEPSVWSGTTDAVVELANGDLLMPLYDNRGTVREGGGDRSFLKRSTDGGKSWCDWGVMGFDPLANVDFDEPALAALPSGKLVAMLREERKKECLWVTESLDDGESWSTPRRTPIWGFPADLLPLRSGALLCAYGYRRAPFGVRACLSHDEGRTWDIQNELILRNDGIGPDVGYPSSVQRRDGSIYTAYYLSERSEVSTLSSSSTGSDDPAAHFSGGGVRFIAASVYPEWR